MIWRAASCSAAVRPSRQAPGVAARRKLSGPRPPFGHGIERVLGRNRLHSLRPRRQAEPPFQLAEAGSGVGEQVLVPDFEA
jgi:hypothetical protein